MFIFIVFVSSTCLVSLNKLLVCAGNATIVFHVSRDIYIALAWHVFISGSLTREDCSVNRNSKAIAWCSHLYAWRNSIYRCDITLTEAWLLDEVHVQDNIIPWSAYSICAVRIYLVYYLIMLASITNEVPSTQSNIVFIV
jgi:hypothetical protein